MNKLLIYTLLFHIWCAASPVSSAQTSPSQAVVHAVLFYSPNCGHCHLVITESLPPLFEQYGEQLSIVGVDVTQPDGQALFLAVLQYFNLESSGVPFLVVGDTYLVGSVDIPGKFPGLIEQYLAQGGVDWPAIPGLAEAMAVPPPTDAMVTPVPQAELTPTDRVVLTPSAPAAEVSASPAPVAATPTSTPGIIITGDPTGSAGANFARDPLGNGLAVLVLAAMILSIGGAIIFLRRTPGRGATRVAALASWQGWLIPILSLIGLGVAGYLAYVETARVDAVCGPVGDCNTVQQSEYARLFGVLPIGVLGLVGYVMILLAWGIERSANQRLAVYASLAIFGMTIFGVLFSIYLTFLEPFVIGATCAWCLTSAIMMTALFWLSLAPARAALYYLSNKEKPC